MSNDTEACCRIPNALICDVHLPILCREFSPSVSTVLELCHRLRLHLGKLDRDCSVAAHVQPMWEGVQQSSLHRVNWRISVWWLISNPYKQPHRIITPVPRFIYLLGCMGATSHLSPTLVSSSYYVMQTLHHLFNPFMIIKVDRMLLVDVRSTLSFVDRRGIATTLTTSTSVLRRLRVLLDWNG